MAEFVPSPCFDVLGNGQIFILSSCIAHAQWSVAPDALIEVVPASASDIELGHACERSVAAFRPLTIPEVEAFFGDHANIKAVRERHFEKVAEKAGFRGVAGMLKGMKACFADVRPEGKLIVYPSRRRSAGKWQGLLPGHELVLPPGYSVEEMGAAIREGIERSC